MNITLERKWLEWVKACCQKPCSPLTAPIWVLVKMYRRLNNILIQFFYVLIFHNFMASAADPEDKKL